MGFEVEQALQSSVGPVAFIAVGGSILFANDFSGLLVQDAASDAHRRDFSVEKTLLLSASSALLTQKRIFVLRLAIHFVSFSDYLRGVTHHHVNSGHLLQQSGMRVVVSRDHADAFHAAADCSIHTLADNLVGGHRDRL